MSQDDKDELRDYASPPCLLHEIDPVYAGLAAPVEPPRPKPADERDGQAAPPDAGAGASAGLPAA